MAMCEACAAIVTGRRHEKGHDGLTEIGKSKQNWGTGAVYTTKYRCSACGSLWEYEDDKNDNGAGWTLAKAA